MNLRGPGVDRRRPQGGCCVGPGCGTLLRHPRITAFKVPLLAHLVVESAGLGGLIPLTGPGP